MRTRINTSSFAFVFCLVVVCITCIHLYTSQSVSGVSNEILLERLSSALSKNRTDLDCASSKVKGRNMPLDMLGRDERLMQKFASLAGPQREQNDPEVIQFIRDEIIEERRPFMPKMSRLLYKTPQADEVEKLFNASKKNGFFVEAGGLDGERSSNTIWFEKKHNWKGFLVEMDPSYYLQLRGKNRHCHTANACLSSKNYSIMVPFKEQRGGNTAITSKATKTTIDTMCFPLFSMMLALNRTKIDYLSLDVEGEEIAVLQTIPFDKLDITTMSVEYLHADKDKMKALMDANGYRLAKTLTYDNPKIDQFSYDYIFVKKGFAST